MTQIVNYNVVMAIYNLKFFNNQNVQIYTALLHSAIIYHNAKY